MATVTKGGVLPDTGVTKAEVYALVDSATVTAIVNADVAAAAAITASKLAFAGITTALTYTSNKPKRSIILTAAGATVPAASGAEQVQTDGTNVSYFTLNFDDAADEIAYWTFVMPDSYDDGSLFVTVYYIPADGSTAGDKVEFNLSFHDITANLAEAVDAAPGSAGVIEDVILNATPNDELHATTEVEIATPDVRAGDLIIAKLFRDVSEEDDMVEDAKVFAVKIEYAVDAESD